MINDKAILVGVDGSHASYKATWWAANYAKHAGLTLQIVCAYSLPSYAAVSFDATPFRVLINRGGGGFGEQILLHRTRLRERT